MPFPVSHWASTAVGGGEEVWGENTGDDHAGVTEAVHLWRGEPDTNQNASTYLDLKNTVGLSSFDRDIVIRFNLAAMASRLCTTAQVEIYNVGTETNEFFNLDTHQEIDPWVQTTATWNKYDGVNAWSAGHGWGSLLASPVIVTGWNYITGLASEVNANVNGTLDLLILELSESNRGFQGVKPNGTDGQRPRLRLTF